MKIILDCDLMRHPNSGLYHYCLNLGTEVGELLHAEGSGKMYTYVPPEEKHTFSFPVKTIREKGNMWNILGKPFRGAHIWHAPFQSGRIVPDRKKYPDMKVLLTIHDLNPLHEGKSFKEQSKSLAHTQSLIDKSDAIVCISSFCREDVIKNCDVGSRPIHVIHNGTHKVHEPLLTDTSYVPSRPFMFGMGYVNAKKNYHVLLPLLHHTEMELVIAGRLDEPDYVEKIRRTAEQMGVQDRLQLTGPVSEGEKGWYLRNCTAFVHPSLAEGFGAPVVEAMQFGKPLFLSALTSLPEIGGDAAFYFRSFDDHAMVDVFRNGMERYRRGNLSPVIQMRATAFNWKIKAKEYLEVYKSLM